jgi:hypothetical protein
MMMVVVNEEFREISILVFYRYTKRDVFVVICWGRADFAIVVQDH